MPLQESQKYTLHIEETCTILFLLCCPVFLAKNEDEVQDENSSPYTPNSYSLSEQFARIE